MSKVDLNQKERSLLGIALTHAIYAGYMDGRDFKPANRLLWKISAAHAIASNITRRYQQRRIVSPAPRRIKSKSKSKRVRR